MNKIYKIVWNKALGQMVVVSEHAKSAAKGTTIGTHLSRPLHKTQNVSACPQWLLCSLSLSMALVANVTWAGVANTALPTGANITQGSAQISQNNNSLNINQNSQNLSTNWNTFNIGKDATVNFNQPNQSSIAVNRVLDNNASQIMGKLNANGQVFLLNPNGVIFSKTAQVNVGGIVASTLNLSDSDIAQGKFTLKNNGNAGSVENYGSIIANGGVVTLIAPTVKNHGTIQANNGVVHLTAADQVTLQLQDGSLVEYQIDLGTLQGLVENGGAIQADNGAVYLTAQAKNSLSKAVVNHTGIIEANRLSKNAKGEIILLGDMQTGTTTVSGTLKAEGKNGADGGFIETSAANVQIQDSTKVSTLSDSGKTGEWLIDPFNVTISNQAQAGNNNAANTFTPSQNDSIINVGTLNSALASNNITVTTAGAGTQAGNINVNADVTWNANTALTLRADNDIHINANITATGNTGKLNLQYGQTTSNSNASYYLNNGAKVNLKAGQNFSTQKGTDAPINYTVITDLGAAGSTTKTDLQGISGGLAGNYVLGADIDATATSGWNNGQGFNPIGNSSNRFTGKFDGLNHTISNLTINRPLQEFVGLFGATSNTTIQNIGLIQANIKGNLGVGALIGEANSTNTSNAFSTGLVNGDVGVGGLVGINQNQSNILSSYSNAQVTATDIFAGGLSGENLYRSRIENSYATGAVQAQGFSGNAGGLSGNNFDNSVIKNSYATGAVSGIENVGGLLGQNYSGTVENSYATGQVTKTSGSAITFGGLVGGYGGTIKNSYWNSATTGQTRAVGDNSGNRTNVLGLTTAQMFDKNSLSGFDFDIIWGNGYNQTTPYLKNHIGPNNVINKNDTVAGASYAVIQTLNQLQGMSGNLIGKYVLGADIDATATSGWNNGQGFNPIGNSSNRFTGKFDGLNHTISNLTINRPLQEFVGLFGATSNTTIQNIGLIQANIKGNLGVGALIGEANSTNTSNAFSTGLVNGDVGVGGLVGNNQNQSSILSSYSNAQVTATGSFAGGLSGVNQSDSRIENSYATGEVQAKGSNSNAGGLSGNNYTNSVIKNSYATGAVSGIDAVGGLLGNNNSSTVENSYATGQVTRTSGSAITFGGLVGRTGGTIKNSYWNKDTTGQGAAVGNATGTLTQVQGLTTAQMKQGASFVGFNIDGQGGTAKVWRIYEGNTAPLLRSFLTQADISATANQTKAYNGQIQGLDTTIFTGLDSSKIFSSNSSSKNVGTYNVGYYSNQQGYDFIGGSASLTINKADLAITGLSAGDKVYDATTVATLTGTASVSPLGSDSVTLGGTGIANFADKNVGTHKTVTVSGYTLSGADAGNYSLVQPTGLKANISKADLALTGLSAGNKVYDATTVATLTGTPSVSPFGSDSVTLGGTGIANFADKNVGTHKTVIVSGYTLSGADAANYNLVQPTGLKANITPATLTYTANAATSIYGDAITGLTGTVTGFVNGENLANATTGTASFSTTATATSHVGQYAITGSGLTANNSNYDFVQNAANTTALTITPATLTITANAGQHKVYGDIDPTLGYAVSGWKLSDGNSLLTGALGRAAGKNVGNYAINQGSLLATSNYDISYIGADFAITPRTLTATINAQNKVYDGNRSAAVIYGDNRVSGDFLSITGNPATFSDKNAGSNKTVIVNGLTLSGADAGNYVLAATTATDTADISKAQAIVTANSLNTVYNGQNQSVNGFSATGLVDGEDESVLIGVSTAGGTGKNAGSYSHTASGTDSNYNITFVDGALK
ncbi:YDG domain-containing protein, partial [Acinetobacter schindleri]|uniref:YDG domain-containing protein n=1 Tax=Acinetobacter schindleri TaxID=108981 RepID=UPI002FE0F4D4